METPETVTRSWSDGILAACEFLGLQLPTELDDGKSTSPLPSDYLGKNFELDEKTIKQLRKVHGLTAAQFKALFNKFRGVYLSQKVFKHNATDVNVFFVDYLMFARKNSYKYSDYFDFEFYNKPRAEQMKFIGEHYIPKIHALINDYSGYRLLDHKPTANRTFANYIHRDWLDTTVCRFEEFKLFVELHPKFFVKPIGDYGGHRAEIGFIDIESDVAAMFKRYRDNKMMVEELITQHPALSEFSPSAVCTIRVNAMTDPHGAVHILTTGGRIGRAGGVVDNYSSGGMSVIIDPQTGIIVSDAINRFHERVAKHPDTGKTFRGFQYPCWDKVRATVIEMMKVASSLKFVGWDLTITDKNEIELVEANRYPGVRVQQTADSVGKFHIYAPLIEAWERYHDEYFKTFGWRVNNFRRFPNSYQTPSTRRNPRAQLIIKYLIDDCQSVMDVGCRRSKFVKTILPKNIKYYPVDLQKYDDETIECDLRAGELPDIKVDTCLCVITAEYVELLNVFLGNLCNMAQRQILMVCRPIDKERHKGHRYYHPFLTDFTEEFLINTFAANGFELQQSMAAPDNSSVILYDFRRSGG